MKEYLDEKMSTLVTIFFGLLLIGIILVSFIQINKRDSAPLHDISISTFEKNEKIEGTVIGTKRKTKSTYVSLIKTDDDRYFVSRKYITKGRHVKLTAKDSAVVVYGKTEYGTTFATRSELKDLDKIKKIAESKNPTSNDFHFSVFQVIYTK